MVDIIIYETGKHQVDVRMEGETLWLSLQQLADLFERDKSVISRHLKNIFESRELDRDRTVAKNATVQMGLTTPWDLSKYRHIADDIGWLRKRIRVRLH